MRFIAPAVLSLSLLTAAPVFAAPHGNEAPHGEEHAPDAHGTEGDHGDGGHHYLYTADSDHDGTANWMDADEGEHYPLTSIGFHAVNLLLFLGAVFWFGRRPISDGLASRALGVRKEITESARLRDEARQRSTDLGDRLDRIEAEIAGLREKAVTEAANEEAALIARANTEAERISDAAERSIRDEVTRARFALKRDAVELAVELAEASLKERMNADHQQRLARDFLESIKTDGENRV